MLAPEMVSTHPTGDTYRLAADGSLSDGISRSRTRWGVWILAALLLPAAITELRNASSKPFWSDEICTVAVASQNTPAAIWDALAHAADTQPPFFYIVTALINRVVGNPYVAYRLPALLGFFCVPFCLYLFVTRRLGWAAGLVAALVPLASGFQGYASEARPYSLEVACFAVALVCWQRLEDSGWFSVPFGLALGGAVALHYYAVMAVPAFVVAEAIRWYRTGSWRLSAWVPMLACAAPLAEALPLMRTLRTVYGTHFWTGRGPQALLFAYSGLTGFDQTVTVGLVVVLVSILLGWTLTFSPRIAALFSQASTSALRPEETALGAFLLCLPIVTFLAGLVTHGGVIMRYAMPAVLGLALATSYVVASLRRPATELLLAVLIISLGFSSATHARFVFHAQSRSPVDNSTGRRLEGLFRSFPSPDPIAVSSGTDYVALAFYSAPDIRSRLVAVVDPPEALRALGTDTADREVMALQPYLQFNVQDYATFSGAHRRFLLLSSGTPFDWWPGRLVRDGHQVTLRREEGGWRLYEVELRPGHASID